MCGIVGAVAERDVVPILMEGLRRLEYRGYDSAGVAVVGDGALQRHRAVGRVVELSNLLDADPLRGNTGIAHTRWATHGEPTERNAHPHLSSDRVALVHNGIIENHDPLRGEQKDWGYQFTSDTDTEVVVHRIHRYLNGEGLLAAVQRTVRDLRGAYALAVVDREHPGSLVVARMGCPVVIGVGIGENFVASDIAALLPVTRRFIFLEEGDVAEIRRGSIVIVDEHGRPVQRPEVESSMTADSADRGDYSHFMLKEIHEQPRAITETLEDRISRDRVLENAFGVSAGEKFAQVRGVHIIACGTSYHAGLVARYSIESIAGLPCSVEIASEYRYRNPVVPPGTLFVTLSQSGETADTLAALRLAKTLGYAATLAICNVPESSLVRESELVLMTRAGPEIGVASTKAFVTQLVALALLTIVLARRTGTLEEAAEGEMVRALAGLPRQVETVLELNDSLVSLAERFIDKQHALYLGRGPAYPIALEGALKLKEISYIHAEAYPAGELKHGPLALVDEHMPVVTVAPNNELLEKVKANLQEVRARKGVLYVFADQTVDMSETGAEMVLTLPTAHALVAPVLYTIPLQLLAYHVAVLKGTDVDKPRNLAKSVTVE